MTNLEDLTNAVVAFRDERDWLQFHTPKDLAIATSIEAAELLQIFLWRPEAQSLSDDDRTKVMDEMADVLIYLLGMADRLNVDLGEAGKLSGHPLGQ